jgi:flagellar biosynthetic protein FlhB
MKRLPLDLQYFAGEKTEKATPKKREDTRKKGQAPKSQDVNTAVGLLVVFVFLYFFAPRQGQALLELFDKSFKEYMLMDLTAGTLRNVSLEVLEGMFHLLGPVMLVGFLAAAGANLVQVGFMMTAEPLKPKLEKIDPVKGMKRIFSIRALVELLKSILKFGLIGFAAFFVIWLRIDEVLILSHKTVPDALQAISSLTLQMGVTASIALLLLSVLDYLYQRYDFEKNIRMSKQDIKDELKNTEGDPLIKSKVKQRQREMAMARMMQEVPKADVVITNPTHYAVALKYDEKEADAPVVVAKGLDYMAERIKKLAKEHGVVLVENRPLAQALYKQAEIGDQIPEDFFKTVAEILAYVYRVKNRI